MITRQKRIGLLSPEGGRLVDSSGYVLVSQRGLITVSAASLALLDNAVLDDDAALPEDEEQTMTVAVCGADGYWLDAGSGQQFALDQIDVDGDGTLSVRLALSDDPSLAIDDLLGEATTLDALADQSTSARYLYLAITATGSTGIASVTLGIGAFEETETAAPDHEGLRQLSEHIRSRILSHAPLRQMLVHEEAVCLYGSMRPYPRQLPAVFLELASESGSESEYVRTVTVDTYAVAESADDVHAIAGMLRTRLHGHSFLTRRWQVRGFRTLELEQEIENDAFVQTQSFQMLAFEADLIATLSFAFDTTSLTLPLLGQMPTRTSERLQALGRTAGGTRYVHDSGTTLRQREVALVSLTSSERDSLSTFHNTVAASANAFTVTDEDGEELQARFADGKLNFEPDEYGLWKITLKLDLEETGETEEET